MTIGTGSGRATSGPRIGREQEDEDYRQLEEGIRGQLVSRGPFFTTDLEKGELFGIYLSNLPASRRKHYDCRACRRFFDLYGGLVEVNAITGIAYSPFWHEIDPPRFFARAVEALAKRVRRAKVSGVFLSEEIFLGLPKNRDRKANGGVWHHLHAFQSPSKVHRPSPLKTTFATIAEKTEEFGMLRRGLEDFPKDVVELAHTYLTNGQLYRSEKCVGVAKWLLDLHEGLESAREARAKENLTWLAVAGAPPGYCHVRSTMIGTLLEDLSAGKDFTEVKRSFDAKMSPVLYQRPQAAPTHGQLTAAEKVVEKLASAGSLSRRYAHMTELRGRELWIPEAVRNVRSSPLEVFGHLDRRQPIPWGNNVPSQVITWEKFKRTVLQTAERIECLVPYGLANFFAFVTATDPLAPPILQWDSEEDSNPVSWYLYNGGSLAYNWNLRSGDWKPVEGIFGQPSSWGARSLDHQGDGAYFVLAGARDLRGSGVGLALFPEILKSEYHGIRAAIEAYSRSKVLTDPDPIVSPACGICLQKNGAGSWNVSFRVESRGVRAGYVIDRWD